MLLSWNRTGLSPPFCLSGFLLRLALFRQRLGRHINGRDPPYLQPLALGVREVNPMLYLFTGRPDPARIATQQAINDRREL